MQPDDQKDPRPPNPLPEKSGSKSFTTNTGEQLAGNTQSTPADVCLIDVCWALTGLNCKACWAAHFPAHCCAGFVIDQSNKSTLGKEDTDEDEVMQLLIELRISNDGESSAAARQQTLSAVRGAHCEMGCLLHRLMHAEAAPAAAASMVMVTLLCIYRLCVGCLPQCVHSLYSVMLTAC